jgi:hypothetical protein
VFGCRVQLFGMGLTQLDPRLVRGSHGFNMEENIPTRCGSG